MILKKQCIIDINGCCSIKKKVREWDEMKLRGSQLRQLAEKLRNVEIKIRNLAAHEIVSIKDGTIKELTGLTGNQIMNMIKDIFAYTGIGVKREYWNSYDDMNQKFWKSWRRANLRDKGS